MGLPFFAIELRGSSPPKSVKGRTSLEPKRIFEIALWRDVPPTWSARKDCVHGVLEAPGHDPAPERPRPPLDGEDPHPVHSVELRAGPASTARGAQVTQEQ